MSSALWIRCLGELEHELDEQLFNTWILPLQAIEDDGVLKLLAPNRYVVDWINQNYLDRITGAVRHVAGNRAPVVLLEVGSVETVSPRVVTPPSAEPKPRVREVMGSRLDRNFTFPTFVEGKSNQLARAAAFQGGHEPRHGLQPRCSSTAASASARLT